MFPKQYPQWRPPAQWSKTIGYSHNGSMSLFRAGSAVSDGVRQFVEKGDTHMMEKESADLSFLDAVIAPPIQQGEGRTEALVFVDGNNTKVCSVLSIFHTNQTQPSAGILHDRYSSLSRLVHRSG